MPLQPHNNGEVVFNSRFLTDLADAYEMHLLNARQFGNTPMVALLQHTMNALALYAADLDDLLNVRLPPPEEPKSNVST